jgi:hypothetical protein
MTLDFVRDTGSYEYTGNKAVITRFTVPEGELHYVDLIQCVIDGGNTGDGDGGPEVYIHDPEFIDEGLEHGSRELSDLNGYRASITPRKDFDFGEANIGAYAYGGQDILLYGGTGGSGDGDTIYYELTRRRIL